MELLDYSRYVIAYFTLLRNNFHVTRFVKSNRRLLAEKILKKIKIFCQMKGLYPPNFTAKLFVLKSEKIRLKECIEYNFQDYVKISSKNEISKKIFFKKIRNYLKNFFNTCLNFDVNKISDKFLMIRKLKCW